MVECPVCKKQIPHEKINEHLDSSECNLDITGETPSTEPPTAPVPTSRPRFMPLPSTPNRGVKPQTNISKPNTPLASIFRAKSHHPPTSPPPTKRKVPAPASEQDFPQSSPPPPPPSSTKPAHIPGILQEESKAEWEQPPPPKKVKTRSENLTSAMPLAEKMRPRTLDDIVGQDAAKILKGMLETTGKVPSILLVGPPGCGKTTLAKAVAGQAGVRIAEVVGGEGGVQDVKKVFTQAKSDLALTGRKTILFCDEIHRFTKAQQDVFLGPVEKGEITLIGATTENPGFRIQNALLSRLRTFNLTPLTTSSITQILDRALTHEYPTTPPHHLLTTPDLHLQIAHLASGDARTALNLLELSISVLAQNPTFTIQQLLKSLPKSPPSYDRAGDQHFDQISAFQKSIRGSDPDAALFYLGRMLQAGEDPLYIVRRLIVIASEDVGLADNTMLPLAIATLQAIQAVGMPEGRLNLAHCTVALALAKKSNRAYKGLSNVMAILDEGEGNGALGLEVPQHLRNGARGKGYKYPHDYVGMKVDQTYLPKKLVGKKFLPEEGEGQVKVDEDTQRFMPLGERRQE